MEIRYNIIRLTILILSYHTLTISLTYLKTSDQAACGFALPSPGTRLSLLPERREAWTRHGSSRMQAWGTSRTASPMNRDSRYHCFIPLTPDCTL